MINLTELAVTSISEPRKVARQLVELKLDGSVLWMVYALILVLATLIYSVSSLGAPVAGQPIAPMSTTQFFAVQAVIIASSVSGMWFIGTLLGGKGSFADVATPMLWLNLLAIVGQIGVMIVALALPSLSTLLFLAIVFLSLWITHQFIVEAHGFDTAWKGVMVIVATFIAIAVVLSFVLSFAGLVPQEVTPNV